MPSHQRCALIQVLLLVLLDSMLAACGTVGVDSRRGPQSSPPITRSSLETMPDPASVPPTPPGRTAGPIPCDLSPRDCAQVDAVRATTPAAGTILDSRLPARPSLLPAPKVALLWSTGGTADGLRLPIALAVDRHGDLYVVDVDQHRLQVFDRDGRFLRQWGGEGGDAGQFRFGGAARCDNLGTCVPSVGGGVAIDGQDRIYVADWGNHRIQQFDRTGRLLAHWGRFGNGPGEFFLPHGIAVDGHGHVYVSDSGNDRIQVFDSTGRFLAQWGRQGIGAAEFDRPGALTVDASGQVYVVDDAHTGIQQFDQQGRFLAQWPISDLTGHAAPRITGLAVDRRGQVYVSDTGGYVHLLAPAGEVTLTWDTGWLGEGQLRTTAAVAVDTAGDVYVADQDASRLHKFRVLLAVTS